MDNLSPPKSFELPHTCRGALTLWPQLENSMTQIAGDADQLECLTSNGCIPIGNAKKALITLASSPNMFQADNPPLDIYAQVIWVASKTAAAEIEISQRLSSIPKIIALAPSDETSSIKRLFEREGSLSTLALGLSKQIETLAEALKEDADLETTAVQPYNEVIGDIQNDVAELTSAGSGNEFNLLSTLVQAKSKIDNDLGRLGLASSRVNIAAVIKNLYTAFDALSKAWAEVATSFTDFATSLSDTSITDASVFSKNMNLDSAVQQWTRYATETQDFIQRSLIARA